MSKKLVNGIDTVVDEALDGLVAIYPGLVRLDGHRVLLRADTPTLVQQGKVNKYSYNYNNYKKIHKF